MIAGASQHALRTHKYCVKILWTKQYAAAEICALVHRHAGTTFLINLVREQNHPGNQIVVPAIYLYTFSMLKHHQISMDQLKYPSICHTKHLLTNTLDAALVLWCADFVETNNGYYKYLRYPAGLEFRLSLGRESPYQHLWMEGSWNAWER